MANTDIIMGVFSGTYSTSSLPPGLYADISADLLAAVDRGMGRATGMDGLVESLNLNAQAFAGAKTYNIIRDIESLARANVANFDEQAQAILAKYKNWGDAEVNTAQQQTHQAKQWQIIEEDKVLFPILQYKTIGDACKICRPLDGLTDYVNSPIWRRVYPCNHYNCYCIVVQLTAGEPLTPNAAHLAAESEKLMSPVFISNPGITKQLFTGDHPYFTSIPAADRDRAKENFGLPIK
jgi:hypothetical protein